MTKVLLIFFLVLSFTLPLFAQVVDTAWVQRYNGPRNLDDFARALAVDSAGNVYVTGSTDGIGTFTDYATIKYDSNGDTVWLRRYNGPGNGGDEAFAIAVDDSGNVYVTGSDVGSVSYGDYATVKYYPNGDTAWVRRYNGPGNLEDAASAIAVDRVGNVYVTGNSDGGGGTFADYTTIKYYPNGDTAWIRRYNGPGNLEDAASAIAVDSVGNVYVTGWGKGGVNDYDYTTIKYDSEGTQLWVKRYDGGGYVDDYAYDIAVDDSGNVYVTGQASDLYNIYATTIKYNSNGDSVWLRRYDGLAYAIALDDSGNVYVTGASNPGPECTTIKYNSSGDTVWVRRYGGGPGDCAGWGTAVVTDVSGNVYVTGLNCKTETGEDYATIKYYPDGDTAWVRRYNGPGDYYKNDRAYAIAVDGSGNVYVTGWSDGIGTGCDYATIKYSYKSRHDTLQCLAYSPVDLIVRAPNGDSIGVSFNTIANATYDTTTDKNGDGDKDDIVTIPNPLVGEYMVRVVTELGGSGNYTLAVKLDGNEDRVMIDNAACPGPGEVDTVYYPVTEYLRGDPNKDGKKNVSDVIFLINYLFKGGPAPNPVSLGDANCDDKVNVTDAIYLINYLFKSGHPPCS